MNPILQSESFERAAYSIRDSGEQLARVQGWFSENAETLRQTQGSFADSVNKLVTAMGMQAENMQRQAVGFSVAYTEADFEKVVRS